MTPFLVLLYGISFGFPDIALDFIGTRIRLDDLFLCIIFLLFVFFKKISNLNRFHRSFITMYLLFASYCLLSVTIGTLSGFPFNSYSFSRLIGCLLILITLPLILKNTLLRKRFILGLVFGGCIFAVQFLWKWNSIMLSESQLFINDFNKVKSVVSFDTWNPNSIANFALFFIVSFLILKRGSTKFKTGIFWIIACLFSLIPFLIFSRGASICIIVGWSLWFLMSKNNVFFKFILGSAIILATLFFISKFSFLLQEASQINLTTGEGFSGRYEFWKFSLKLIKERLLFGHGFGQELFLFKQAFGTGMSHNAFLSVLVEDGITGFLLFLSPLIYLFLNLWSRFKKTQDENSLIALSFLIGFLIFNFSQSELYWCKAGILSLCVLASPLTCLKETRPFWSGWIRIHL